MKILIIEDDGTIASFMAHKLSANIQGAETRIAHTLAEAYAALDEFRPDVISLDLNLNPGENFEVMFDKIPFFKTYAPVVVVSGIVYYEPSFRDKAISQGAFDCIDKNLMTSKFFVDTIVNAAATK